MDRMLYLAMTGAKDLLLAQSVNSHNLANASTTGFRADMESFLSQPVYGDHHPSRAYAVDGYQSVDFSPGKVSTTGRELDVAIRGEGWIAVQAADGQEALTRAGDLRVDALGQLVTGAGHPVLGNGGPIAVPPNARLDIAADGTITVHPMGQDIRALAVVDRIKLVNPAVSELTKGQDGLFRQRNGGETQPDASVQLISGALESSNVSPVQGMVRMIELARAYEHQVKLMQTAEETDKASAQIMQLPG